MANRIINNIELVPWSTGTNSQIFKMINGFYRNLISLNDIKTVWHVGDRRSIYMSDFPQLNPSVLDVNSSYYMIEKYPNQFVEFSIVGFECDKLAEPSGAHRKALITVRQTTFLKDEDGKIITAYFDDRLLSNKNTDPRWINSKRRDWCKYYYFSALPEAYQKIIKPVIKKTYSPSLYELGQGNLSGYNESEEMIFLPSLSEIDLMNIRIRRLNFSEEEYNEGDLYPYESCRYYKTFENFDIVEGTRTLLQPNSVSYIIPCDGRDYKQVNDKIQGWIHVYYPYINDLYNDHYFDELPWIEKDRDERRHIWEEEVKEGLHQGEEFDDTLYDEFGVFDSEANYFRWEINKQGRNYKIIPNTERDNGTSIHQLYYNNTSNYYGGVYKHINIFESLDNNLATFPSFYTNCKFPDPDAKDMIMRLKVTFYKNSDYIFAKNQTLSDTVISPIIIKVKDEVFYCEDCDDTELSITGNYRYNGYGIYKIGIDLNNLKAYKIKVEVGCYYCRPNDNIYKAVMNYEGNLDYLGNNDSVKLAYRPMFCL